MRVNEHEKSKELKRKSKYFYSCGYENSQENSIIKYYMKKIHSNSRTINSEQF